MMKKILVLWITLFTVPSLKIVEARTLANAPSLIVDAGNSEDEFVFQAIKALQRYQDHPDKIYFTRVAEYLQYESPEVVMKARSALRRIPEWKELALELARSDQPRYRLLATKVLILDRENPEFATAFTELLQDKVSLVRRKAAMEAPFWAGISTTSVVRESLKEAAKHESNRVIRSNMVANMGPLCNESCMERLVKASSDRATEVRRAAIQSLGYLASDKKSGAQEKAVDRLIEIAEGKKTDDRERIVAFQQLARTASPAGKNALRGIASEDEGYSESVRQEAQRLAEGLESK